jgi:hypothetical protein
VRDIEVDHRFGTQLQLDVVFRGRQIRGSEMRGGNLSGPVAGEPEAATLAV